MTRLVLLALAQKTETMIHVLTIIGKIFEMQVRGIIGLERLMLESSGFDFRNRHPQNLLMKLIKNFGFDKNSRTARVAYEMTLDLYRTFAPLKQTSATMAFACLELAGRLLNDRNKSVEAAGSYKRWRISRAEVMGKCSGSSINLVYMFKTGD